MEGINKQNEIWSQEPRSTNNNQEQIKETKKIENLKKQDQPEKKKTQELQGKTKKKKKI